MAGKKRRLKKIAKRKLRKEGLTATDSKRKDEENKENKVPKIDNMSLQQLMMAQMMSSRARSSNGEGAGWISVQNQANADKVRQQQELNEAKKEAEKWKKEAQDIEHNEKHREMMKKYEDQIEEYKRKIKDTEEMKDKLKEMNELEEENKRLVDEKNRLEKELNDPVNKQKLENMKLDALNDELRERIGKIDKEDKTLNEKWAKTKSRYDDLVNKQKRLEEVNRKTEEMQKKKAELKVQFENARDKNPELQGIRYDGGQIDEKMNEIEAARANIITKYNKYIEMLKEGSKEMTTLKETRDACNMHIRNMVKEHPLFLPIYDANLNKLGENKTLEGQMEAFNKSLYNYGANLALNTMYILEGHAALNRNHDVTETESKISELIDRERENNPVYKTFRDRIQTDPLPPEYVQFVYDQMSGFTDVSRDDVNKTLVSIAKGEKPSFVNADTKRWSWDNENEMPLTSITKLAEKTINEIDETSLAQFGPGTE